MSAVRNLWLRTIRPSTPSARREPVTTTVLPSHRVERAVAAVLPLQRPAEPSAVDQVRAADASDPRPLCRDPWCPQRVERPGNLCAEHRAQHEPRRGVELNQRERRLAAKRGRR